MGLSTQQRKKIFNKTEISTRYIHQYETDKEITTSDAKIKLLISYKHEKINNTFFM